METRINVDARGWFLEVGTFATEEEAEAYRDRRARLLVTVQGGIVQDVCSDTAGIEVVIADYDEEDRGCESCMVDDDGSLYHAAVYDFDPDGDTLFVTPEGTELVRRYFEDHKAWNESDAAKAETEQKAKDAATWAA